MPRNFFLVVWVVIVSVTCSIIAMAVVGDGPNQRLPKIYMDVEPGVVCEVDGYNVHCYPSRAR